MISNLPNFIPGLKLCEIFYHEAVRPIFDRHFPNVPHTAARLDYGSDVLGFDTAQSRDHGWGPKVTLFLTLANYQRYSDRISEVMSAELPVEIRGYPTNFDTPFSGDGSMQAIESGPVRHWVGVTTIANFFNHYLGIDPTQPLSVIDWLTMPQQHLRTVASGRVFHDSLKQLDILREQLRWYPRDVWFYLMANQWRRIDQEEPFMARCGDVGDEIGSRILAYRQINEVIKLCFLIEQQYTPYYKWFGTAFNRLACAPLLAPIFQRILDSQSWKEREGHLSAAYLILMQMHNDLGITPEIMPEISRFFNRPYKVPHSARFVDALHEAIQSDVVRNLPEHIGGVDQFVNSTDITSDPLKAKQLAVLYKNR